MTRRVVRVAYHPSKNRWVGKYMIEDKIRTVQLCTDADLDERGLNKKKNEAKRSLFLDELYLRKYPTQKVQHRLTPFERNRKDFLKHIEAVCDYRTLVSYRGTLNRLTDLTADAISEFIVMNRQMGLKDSSINSHLRCIKRFSRWVAERDNTRPVKITFLREVKKTIKAYTPEQVETVTNYLISQWHSTEERRYWIQLKAVTFMSCLGLRGGEINSLHWDDVNLLRNTVHIHDNEFNRVKGRKDVYLPMPDKLRQFIQSIPEEERFGYVLERYYRNVQILSRAFHRLHDKMEFTGAKSLHGYRAYFCTQLFNSGRQAPKVQRLMRHSSLVTTNLYLDEEQDQLADAINVF